MFNWLWEWMFGSPTSTTPPPAGTPPPMTPMVPSPTPATVVAACPSLTPESNQLKSIHIDIGWTFTSGAPVGDYTLVLAGQTFTGALNGGAIREDNVLDSLCGSGSLEIRITNGPIFRANVTLDLPEIQTPEGLKRRLTNLGYYAGTDSTFDGRALWALRTFKRVNQNGFSRNATVTEDNTAPQAFLTAVQTAYGTHPNDAISGALAVTEIGRTHAPCGLAGGRVLRRTNFGPFAAGDDRDAEGAGDNGLWENVNPAGQAEPIAGTFDLYLRAFDPAAGDPVIPNRVNLPQHVRMMQFLLFEFGFWVVRGTGGWVTENGTETRTAYTPDGRFGRDSDWAVREFQSYARLDNAAEEDVSLVDKRYLPRLLANSPTALSGGAQLAATVPVSGALNEATRNAFQQWADGKLRCPVVIYGSTDNANPTANGSNFARLAKENLWRHDDHQNANPRMYAIDWSGFYTIPAGHGGTVTANGATFPRPIVVGDWQRYLRWEGPRSIPPRHVWPEGELLVDGLTGSAWAALGTNARSTFRVVRAVSEVECIGFFDSVNSYDNAFVSVGPCHWTLGIADAGGSGAVSDGELCGYLAYLREADRVAFDQVMGNFHVQPDTLWNTNGAALFSNGSRKYSAWMQRRIETGTQAAGTTAQWQNLPQTAAHSEDEGDFFKTWHWFYRFVMAGRTIEGYRERMWHMARVRLRDILDVPWGTGGGGVANVGTVAATIGDVFTSERATGMILRLHIRGPAWVVSGGNAGARLTGALRRARNAQPALGWNTDPSTWTDNHETALIDGIADELVANANAGVQNTVNQVRNWENWGSNPRGYALNIAVVGNSLSADRDSFTLDTANLPAAPP